MSKDTLQLPKTAFSMKANLPHKEPEIFKEREEVKMEPGLGHRGRED